MEASVFDYPWETRPNSYLPRENEKQALVGRNTLAESGNQNTSKEISTKEQIKTFGSNNEHNTSDNSRNQHTVYTSKDSHSTSGKIKHIHQKNKENYLRSRSLETISRFPAEIEPEDDDMHQFQEVEHARVDATVAESNHYVKKKDTPPMAAIRSGKLNLKPDSALHPNSEQSAERSSNGRRILNKSMEDLIAIHKRTQSSDALQLRIARTTALKSKSQENLTSAGVLNQFQLVAFPEEFKTEETINYSSNSDGIQNAPKLSRIQALAKAKHQFPEPKLARATREKQPNEPNKNSRQNTSTTLQSYQTENSSFALKIHGHDQQTKPSQVLEALPESKVQPSVVKPNHKRKEVVNPSRRFPRQAAQNETSNEPQHSRQALRELYSRYNLTNKDGQYINQRPANAISKSFHQSTLVENSTMKTSNRENVSKQTNIEEKLSKSRVPVPDEDIRLDLDAFLDAEEVDFTNRWTNRRSVETPTEHGDLDSCERPTGSTDTERTIADPESHLQDGVLWRSKEMQNAMVNQIKQDGSQKLSKNTRFLTTDLESAASTHLTSEPQSTLDQQRYTQSSSSHVQTTGNFEKTCLFDVMTRIGSPCSTDRSSAASLWEDDDFAMEATNRVCEIFESIDQIMYHGLRVKGVPERVLTECADWRREFPHLRVEGSKSASGVEDSSEDTCITGGVIMADPVPSCRKQRTDTPTSSSDSLSIRGSKSSVHRFPKVLRSFDDFTHQTIPLTYEQLMEETFYQDGQVEELIAFDQQAELSLFGPQEKFHVPRKKSGVPAATPFPFRDEDVIREVFQRTWREVTSTLQPYLEHRIAGFTSEALRDLMLTPDSNPLMSKFLASYPEQPSFSSGGILNSNLVDSNCKELIKIPTAESESESDAVEYRGVESRASTTENSYYVEAKHTFQPETQIQFKAIKPIYKLRTTKGDSSFQRRDIILSRQSTFTPRKAKPLQSPKQEVRLLAFEQTSKAVENNDRENTKTLTPPSTSTSSSKSEKSLEKTIKQCNPQRQPVVNNLPSRQLETADGGRQIKINVTTPMLPNRQKTQAEVPLKGPLIGRATRIYPKQRPGVFKATIPSTEIANVSKSNSSRRKNALFFV